MWCSKVLVAYDGSASSRKALDLARSIGEQDADVELVLVHVVKLYSSGAAGVGMDTVFVADAEPVREELQQVADALRNPASVRLLKGELSGRPHRAVRRRRGLRPHRHGEPRARRREGVSGQRGATPWCKARPLRYWSPRTTQVRADGGRPARTPDAGAQTSCAESFGGALAEQVLGSRAAKPQRRVPLWTKDFTLGTLVNFLLMVNYYGLMVVIADYAMKTYHASASVAGSAASIFIIGALVARLVSGRAMDRVGRKRLLVGGAVFEVAFSLLYLSGLGLAPLFALRLLHGIAYGACSTTIGTIVTALVPDSRKGEGVGYYMLSVTLGAAIGPFLGMFLTQSAGYRVLFVVTAAVAVLCLAVAAALKAPEAGDVRREEVERRGREIARAEREERARGFRVPRPRLSNYIETSVVPISAVCALLFFCYSSLLTFLTPFAEERGLAEPASFFFVVYAIATFVTRPFTGKLFDRYGDRVVMIPSFIAFVCGMALLATVYRAPAMLIAAALLGFGVGTVQASGLALAVRIAPDSRLSLANSTFYVLLDIGVGIGPLVLGMVQPLWGYAGLFTAMAGVALAALAAYLVVSRKHGTMRKRLGGK